MTLVSRSTTANPMQATRLTRDQHVCSGMRPAPRSSLSHALLQRRHDLEQLSRGGMLYDVSCRRRHGLVLLHPRVSPAPRYGRHHGPRRDRDR